eukprot:CAMPEP_0170195674 /NCGR_PEP_ID=MMETSP0040_2-20121228/61943_1 /TAXON_ID=641309 /ORGANISM="Lotharella oceanica, Strain CCMP622" /LENGTH=289 /DNA_ID=CAMNT_0010444887 /DNA_START=130 /DNA_END=1000 /DNA_ORIENTATION=-
MWGIRVASAAYKEEYTEVLISNLDVYKSYGINTVTVFYMGSSGGYSDPFNANGTGWIDTGVRNRMRKIIRECNIRGMVVIVGIFYQRSDKPSLKNWRAVQEAVKTVARELSQGSRNVIANIANEQNSNRYSRLPWSRVRNPDDLIKLCQIFKTVAPDIPVGGGGYDHEKNIVIGRSKHVDALLWDTKGPENSKLLYDRFKKARVRSIPMVNVECFGGWTRRFTKGIFNTAKGRKKYLDEADRCQAQPGLYFFFPVVPGTKGHQLEEEIGSMLEGLGFRMTQVYGGIWNT